MMKEVCGITISLKNKKNIYLRCEDGFCAVSVSGSDLKTENLSSVLTLGGDFVTMDYPLILPGELL